MNIATNIKIITIIITIIKLKLSALVSLTTAQNFTKLFNFM